MSDRYTSHYYILGIGPEASWDELRQAYKSLVNIWHPDRFQQDGRRRKLAEEKTKEITQSYKVLAEYYKEHGALPHVFEKQEIPRATEDVAPPYAADSVIEPEIQDAAPAATPVETPKKKRFKFPSFITAAAVAGTVYFVMQIVAWERANNPPQGGNLDETPTAQVAEAQKDKPDKGEDAENETPKTEKSFTVGASLGEVYAIQGVPTKTENDVWYYGQSKIYFSKGKVVRWEENPDNPLRANVNPEDAKMRSEFFGKGSTKNDVLTVQGSPDRDSGSVWDYGTSRVYFEKGHVKGWDESPFNPLKVRH